MIWRQFDTAVTPFLYPFSSTHSTFFLFSKQGLALVVKRTPTLLALTDQHLLSFLSELLKMCSVADNEMNDPSLKDSSVDKNGMVDALPDQQKPGNLTHASALFFRRESAIEIPGGRFVLPEELPTGIQLRVSSILLLHSVIRAHPGPFFEAESSTPIGNIRPHIISLLFRSLVSKPTKAVIAAHGALKDVLALSDTKTEEGGSSSQSQLPKELIQTCIRPVLLNLRDFTRLSVPLLRGLSRLLSLLSSWFNKTLGEKLLDHLQKWTEPSRIMALSKWEGEEPRVAAAIVNIFSMLPHASNFVEPLVKTCIKLENTLPVFKTRLTESPYRKPLARYLNKYPQHATNFFFQRLKTPIYSELFLALIQLEESAPLRIFLSNKPSSVMILNVCFERPLAIIRSEKSSSGGLSTRTSLPVHGIGSSVGAEAATGDGTISMNIEALELQHQGFRLIRTLLEHNSGYFRDHSDIHRAIRWLYRSKGRYLRFQHEDQIPPRFHSESRSLALFLMSNTHTSFDDMDILFELIRVFLQPSTCDFGFVSRFLRHMVCNVLDFEHKKLVVNRFFALLTGESNEETKVLSIQYIVFPMLFAPVAPPEKNLLIDTALVEKFVNEVLFQKGNPVPSGDRLRVELLKMTSMLVDRGATHVQPFRDEIVRFCKGLLKSDDTACKSWAYVVICRVISKFETPVKVTQQVCTTLFRSSQQEGKELVRSGLDLLVPALQERLPKDDFQKAIEQVAQMMLQDANSVAHICQTIVRDPGVFSPYKNRFIGGMLNSLPRLGLPPNCPLESRVLSVDVVELLVEWINNGATLPQSVIIGHMETIANFLVRLRMAMAEPLDGRSSKMDAGAVRLDHRVKHLFEKVLGTWKGTIHTQPLEKILSIKDKPKPSESAMLYSCVEVVTAMIDAGMLDFFVINSGLMNKIANVCFLNARDDLLLRSRLQSFISSAGTTPALTALVAVALEKILLDAATEQRKAASHRAYDQTSKAASRSRDKNSALDDSTVALSYALFALELIDEICRKHVGFRRRIGSTVLSLAGVLTKNHLLEATAKQRQGSSSAPRTAASGIMHHTPTKGILEQGCTKESSTCTPPGGRGRSTKENAESSDVVRALYFSLSIFENSDIPYLFTQDRKVLVHLLSSILDSSDNVLLLMMSTRFVGKWLLSDSAGLPVTVKERNSLLWKLSSFDARCLPDDVAAQPLADLVRHFVASVSPSVAGDNLVFGRTLAACLLHANEPARKEVFSIYFDMRKSPEAPQLQDPNFHDSKRNPSCLDVLWRLLHGDYEGLGGRFWLVVFVEALLDRVSAKENFFLSSIRVLCHGDETLCQMLFEKLLPVVWEQLPDDGTRCRIARAIESLLSRPFHSQFLREGKIHRQGRCTINAVRSFLNVLPLLRPVPVLDTGLLVSLAENYNSWHEVLSMLEKQYVALSLEPSASEMLSAMRHCYRQLGEESIWMILARESCNWPLSRRALSLDIYGLVNEACDAYGELVSNVDAESLIEPSDFEMDMWEERWIELQREVCQLQVVSEFANTSASHRLQLECAWKAQDWNKVRALCASTTLLAAAESGDTSVKMSETLLAVADGKLSDVENLHAQTAQLCLYKWQLLPQLSSGSPAHAGLLHFFHRLVEVRESGQIMVETTAHSNGRTLPDLKNLLSAWRHRLPNDCESLTVWDEVFSWRAHMFSAITKNFHFADPNMLASLHDRPWAAIRMAKTARKQGMRDVSLLLLNKAAEEKAMNVSDAYLKLREQILAYFSPESDLERHGGLNLINTTNLSFFDPSQKSELFRLKAMFLASLGGRSKANQAYCHSVQICPTHARAWDSWGGLCSALGAVAEQQMERSAATGSSEAGKEAAAASAKKVSQYLAQAMGCYLEAVQIDTHEWARLHLPKCWWMFTKDGSSPGVICTTFESRAIGLPSWVWLPWLPQLLTSLYRPEGRVIKRILANVARAYPQAVYCKLFFSLSFRPHVKIFCS
jgi:FAT domain